jgi:hypothetical protein
MSSETPQMVSWAPPTRERLAALLRELDEARESIRRILDAFADRHGIPRKDVTYAIENYTDHMLSDLVFQLERDLERKIQGEAEREGRREHQTIL